jgi:cell wall-associated NlpC family hydrolase
MKRVMVLMVAVLALLASAACKSDNKVGNKSLLDFKDQAQNRLGETTTTAAAASTTTAKGGVTSTTKATVKPGAAASTTTTARAGTASTATTATTAPKATTQTVREIDIYDDNEPGHDALEPQIQTAYVGSVIRWVNKGKTARVVKADSGQFASPSIAPGASWDYTAGTVGIFAYSDDTRPYVTGELRVSKP